MLLNRNGYTFLHLLYSLTVTLLIISTFSAILTFFLKTSEHSTDLHPYEWHVFLIQLQKDIKRANHFHVESNSIQYENTKGEQITIHQFGQVLRYQNNGTGHIVMLQNVTEATFQQVTNGVAIQVKSLNEKIYSSIIRDPKGVVRQNE